MRACSKNRSVGFELSRMLSQQMKERWKWRDKSQHNGRKLCSLFDTFQQIRMKTKSNDLSFIHGPFEGRFKPKMGPSPLVLSLFVGPRPILNGIQMIRLCYLCNTFLYLSLHNLVTTLCPTNLFITNFALWHHFFPRIARSSPRQKWCRREAIICWIMAERL